MTLEATMTQTEHGVRPADGGWFVLNVAQAQWRRSPKFGATHDPREAYADCPASEDAPSPWAPWA